MTYIEKITHYLGEQFNLPKEQVKGMLPEFKKTLSGHMDNLETVTQIRDIMKVKEAGHTLKGALLNLGLKESAERAFQIESSNQSIDSFEDIVDNVKELRRVVDEILSE